MTQLFELPSGDWIDLKNYVRMVEAAEARPEGNGCPAIPPRVIIHLPHDRRVIECLTMTDAQDLRDRLARAVNEAKVKP